MTFSRRVRLFMIGLGLGTIVSWMMLGDRWNMDWAFNGRVHKRMHNTLTKATPAALTALDAKGITLATLKDSIDRFDVGFWSTTRTPDSLYYQMRGTLAGKPLELRVSVMRDYRADSTATLLSITDR